MEYHLDLNTLLLMLRQSTGSLHTDSQHLPGLKGRCQVFLRLEKGMIRGCSIKNERGNEVSSGEVAIKLIQDQVLAWHYREEQPLQVSQEIPDMPFAYKPRQELPRRQFTQPLNSPILSRTHRFIQQSDFLVWPRLYRAVYSLVDGKTSVDDIVRLLAGEQRKERVLEVIVHLRREGFISFDNGFTGKV